MRTAAQERVAALNIRVKSTQRALIEQAAQASGKTVSGFVREAALREAQNTLLDRTAIELDVVGWERFVAALDAPPAPNARLRELPARAHSGDFALELAHGVAQQTRIVGSP